MPARGHDVLGYHEVRPSGAQTWPASSCSMNRPTRVPVSSVVRMNSASNMMAKWYQSAISPWPNAPLRMCAMPTASDGAPPVRPSSVCSPTSAASRVIWSGVTVNPQVADHLGRGLRRAAERGERAR